MEDTPNATTSGNGFQGSQSITGGVAEAANSGFPNFACLPIWQALPLQNSYMRHRSVMSHNLSQATSSIQEHNVHVISDNGRYTYPFGWYESLLGSEGHNVVEEQQISDKFVASAVESVMDCFGRSAAPKSFVWITGPEGQTLLEKTLANDRRFKFTKQCILMANLGRTKTNMHHSLPGKLYPYKRPQKAGNITPLIAAYTPQDIMRFREPTMDLPPDYNEQRRRLSPELFSERVPGEDRYLEVGVDTELQKEQEEMKKRGSSTVTMTISELQDLPGYVESWVRTWSCEAPNTPNSQREVEHWTSIFADVKRGTTKDKFHMFAAVENTTILLPIVVPDTPVPASTANQNPAAFPRAVASAVADATIATASHQKLAYKKTMVSNIIGTGFLHTGSEMTSVHGIVVLPEYRRRGVGTALVEHGKQVAREIGASKLTVTTGPELANSFFHRVGLNICLGNVKSWMWFPVAGGPFLQVDTHKSGQDPEARKKAIMSVDVEKSQAQRVMKEDQILRLLDPQPMDHCSCLDDLPHQAGIEYVERCEDGLLRDKDGVIVVEDCSCQDEFENEDGVEYVERCEDGLLRDKNGVLVVEDCSCQDEFENRDEEGLGSWDEDEFIDYRDENGLIRDENGDVVREDCSCQDEFENRDVEESPMDVDQPQNEDDDEDKDRNDHASRWALLNSNPRALDRQPIQQNNCR